MNDVQRTIEKEILLDALDKDPDERHAFIIQACGDNEGIRAEVERLLANAENAMPGFLLPSGKQAVVIESARESVDEEPLLHVGNKIGPYHIESVLGVGGMAVVYRARQDFPVKRNVAIKVIKPGMDSMAVIRRFNIERKALAMMTHPGIARILDAGIMERGLPYFVVEFVDGQSITTYCDQCQLDIHARLHLFLRVCTAVQHAHSKGIIHRDIKPDNVLVTDESGDPMPKVIDFGIAKALGPDISGGGLTLESQLLGTPEYMCPEQADPAIRDIDVRCDVYSLGTLLYVLLCGALPIPHKSFEGMNPTQIRQVVLDREPTLLSVRIEEIEDNNSILKARGMTSDMLTRKLHGDLDWIVMKALQKDREQRYSTVIELEQDIQRYLNDRPILARPPSSYINCKKFVKRHRISTAVCVAYMLGIFILCGVLWIQSKSLQREAGKLQTINTFLVDVLESPSPADGSGEQQLAELLANASSAVSSSFTDEPEITVSLRQTLSRAYLALGMFDKASDELEFALVQAKSNFGPNHPVTLGVESDLVNVQNSSSPSLLDE